MRLHFMYRFLDVKIILHPISRSFRLYSEGARIRTAMACFPAREILFSPLYKAQGGSGAHPSALPKEYRLFFWT
jgi:hypothetical protein